MSSIVPINRIKADIESSESNSTSRERRKKLVIRIQRAGKEKKKPVIRRPLKIPRPHTNGVEENWVFRPPGKPSSPTRPEIGRRLFIPKRVSAKQISK
jgi:hypothetical protein